MAYIETDAQHTDGDHLYWRDDYSDYVPHTPANRLCDECGATWPENHAWNCSREEQDLWP